MIEASGRSLSIVTSLTQTGRRAVPVSFGYHPYLGLPRGGHRTRWRLHVPTRSHVELDERGIPTGRRRPAPAESRPVGERTFDDLFELTRGRTFALSGGGTRIGVEYGACYRFAQVFAPPVKEFVCLEPMTAPTNALVTGACDVVRLGETFTVRFRIRVDV